MSWLILCIPSHDFHSEASNLIQQVHVCKHHRVISRSTAKRRIWGWFCDVLCIQHIKPYYSLVRSYSSLLKPLQSHSQTTTKATKSTIKATKTTKNILKPLWNHVKTTILSSPKRVCFQGLHCKARTRLKVKELVCCELPQQQPRVRLPGMGGSTGKP